MRSGILFIILYNYKKIKATKKRPNLYIKYKIIKKNSRNCCVCNDFVVVESKIIAISTKFI